MNRLSRTLALAAVAAGLIVARQARPAAQTASLKGDFVKEWAGQKDTLVKIAERDARGQVLVQADARAARFRRPRHAHRADQHDGAATLGAGRLRRPST